MNLQRLNLQEDDLVTSVIQIVGQQGTYVMRLLAFLIYVEIFGMVLTILEVMELVLPTWKYALNITYLICRY